MKFEPSGWYERLRWLLAGKLGACPRCMRASLGLAIAAWAAYGVARAVSLEPLVQAAALVVAGALTTLFLAHIGAFYVRAARHWRAGTLAVDPEGDRARAQNRRRFFVTSGALLGGALLAPLSRLAPVLAASSPPAPCDCDGPNPKEPRVDCPSCRCKTKGPPKKPTTDCNQRVQSPATTTTENGTCVGSLNPCQGDCTLTFNWECQADKKGKGFHWEKAGAQDTCPTAGAPAPRVTDSTGKCHGKGCKPQNAECGKHTLWTCDPHAGEGNEKHGRWAPTTTFEDPSCPVS